MDRDEVLAGLELLASEGKSVPAALRLRLLEQRQAKHAEEFRARAGHDERLDLIDGRTQQ
ncbi:hypothetical protein [Burkholderia vietnamiensis]|uniref:hypothetical protein n=1 Tax=Burkholderia vietnamiensis TaxID=60552 RepID=UPI00158F198E|nr:hypothetical protein [Burkholderia vietnamiensis]MBH9648053.1 hypothetical protein [Burkholderia vietnamiensis]